MKLLGRGVNVNAKNVHDRTALHYAVACKNVEAVDILLRRRARLDLHDKHGVAAIHLAAWFGSLDILKLLVQSGADQRVETEEGMNMMHCAAVNDHTDIVQYIIDDLQMKELDKEDHPCPGISSMFLRLSWWTQQTILRWHAWTYRPGGVKNQSSFSLFFFAPRVLGHYTHHLYISYNVFLYLAQTEVYNSRFLCVCQDGNRPFAVAAEHGRVKMLQMMMEDDYKMVTMEENKNGDTPLHLAARNGQLEAVQLLLHSFEIRNEVNHAGETALYLAADGAHEDCVLALLDADCDPDIQTLDGASPLHAVCEKGHTSVVKLLIDRGAQMNIQNKHLQTPFHMAVKSCYIPVIHTLLESGCDPNITDHLGQTALHTAAELGKVDVVEMILKAGVDMEIKDRQGKTVLGVAARADVVIVVDMIIKAERYYSWIKSSGEATESLHDEYPLTFKLDHRAETKQVRDVMWSLAYKLLKQNEWKKLAHHWEFTEQQVAAIEEQWTGANSYQEHGNRMLLIWLHGAMVAQKNPAKELHHALISVGNAKMAEKLRTEGEDGVRKCTVS
ncbi:uncharacterized protein ankdd1b isoform X2 [Brachyhypopomus gauderio]